MADLCTKPELRPRTKCGDPGKWARTVADEKAIAAGFWFDEGLAAYVVDWFRKYLRHSKGKWAGQPFELLDWQRDEIIMPIFGWLRLGGTRRFRRAYIEISKKNGKSTLASGVGLYMLCGDGENGPEVYSCATDRDQASIVHGEAINMAEASEELDAALKINRTTRNILYDERRGSYRAVSAKPAGKEGLNGNCWIADELHAWFGDELWNALRYMGAARAQPLGFAITTAGDDMESVCRRQHEYAQAVLNGTFDGEEATRFFGYIRGLEPGEPFDTHEARVKANPSLGATIDESELIADVAEARRSPTLMSSTLRYRFNVWSTATNAWLSVDDWRECADDYTEDELAGRPCFAGLDLARKLDFTSLGLLFPDGDKFRQLVYYWLPEETAHARKHLASYLPWADAGWIRLTPGGVCDYKIVEADIVEIFSRFKVREFAFDPQYAEEITQHIESATGVQRFEFRQRHMDFAAPMDEYGRLVASRQMRHNNNPVLSWQAGNVGAEQNRFDGKPIRPTKPSKNDHRTIDGIVAEIMALGRVMLAEPVFDNPYEKRGVVHA